MIRFLFSLLLITTLISCDDDTPSVVTAASQTELLVANNWQVYRVTDINSQLITESRLNATTRSLFALNMQFRANNTVRALDPRQSNNIVNGGTWKLTEDNKSIDVDVQGFDGNFPIVRLDRQQLILRQVAPVDGKKADINLEFKPSL
jgi:hypothetical protein